MPSRVIDVTRYLSMISIMAQIGEAQSERPLPNARQNKRPLPRWQIVLLILMLFAFLAASYSFLQQGADFQRSQPASILYLAEDEKGLLQLFLTKPPSWQPRQLTNEDADVLSFAPSPNGRQIAYSVTFPIGSSQIHLLDLASGVAEPAQVALICDSADASQPVWHPDGRRLLYERRKPPNYNLPQLWWLDTVTGESVLLLEKETAVSSNARFSPDGNWVSFATSPDEGIRIYNFADGRSLNFASNVGTPAIWHPQSIQLLLQNTREVVFHSENDDNHEEHSHDFASAVSLYAASPDTKSTQLLSSEGAFNDGNAAYSPDGEWIAFGRRLARTNTGRQLWLMRADGSEAHALTEDITIHYGPPNWSPDGRFLLFQQYNSALSNQSPSIWLLELATGEFSQIATNGQQPAWLP